MGCWQNSNHNILVKLSLSGKATAKLQTYLNNWHLDVNFLITKTKTNAAIQVKLLCHAPFSACFEMSDFLHLMQEKLRLPPRKLERRCLQLDGEV